MYNIKSDGKKNIKRVINNVQKTTTKKTLCRRTTYEMYKDSRIPEHQEVIDQMDQL